jgi:pimeloyl-ACP methyl ester carboxylesterase
MTTAKATPAAQADDPLAPILIPDQPPFKEGVADLGDTKLWWTDTGGAGVPVVFVHPASGSGLIWLYQRPAFVAAGYRVVTYSRRACHGSSPMTATTRGIGSEDLRKLLDHLKIDKPHIVACAAGGSVAADFAVSYPERLRSLSVSSNAFGVSDGVIAETAKRIRPEQWDTLPWWFRELGPSYRASNPEGVELWIKLEESGSAADGLRQDTKHKITEAMLPGMRTPTLLMTGSGDTSTPPGTLRMLAKRLPECEIFIVPECGHSAYWERPDLFNSVVLDFVSRH